MRRFLSALAAMAVTVQAADAATLINVNGNVLVNTGNGFQTAVEGQTVNPGNRIMVGRGGGSATIAYDLQCIERVALGRVITVQTAVPCNTPGAQTAPAPLGAGVSPGLVVGGVAAAAGVGVLIYLGTKKNSSP